MVHAKIVGERATKPREYWQNAIIIKFPPQAVFLPDMIITFLNFLPSLLFKNDSVTYQKNNL